MNATTVLRVPNPWIFAKFWWKCILVVLSMAGTLCSQHLVCATLRFKFHGGFKKIWMSLGPSHVKPHMGRFFTTRAHAPGNARKPPGTFLHFILIAVSQMFIAKHEKTLIFENRICGNYVRP